jgi:TPR repeat protein
MAHSCNVVARTAVLAGLIALAPGAGLQAQMPLDDLRTLADQGNADAQYNLGVCYLNGTGVRPSTEEAVRWWHLAAEQGHAFAQYNLGYVYDTGQGIEPDLPQAATWYRLAADQGDADAQDALGFMYLNGRGLTQDYAQAVRLFRSPAAQGLATAQFNLGLMHANAWGVPRDDVEAYMWFTLAVAQTSGADHDRMERDLASLTAGMTDNQVAEAQRRVGEWSRAPEP